MRVFCRPNTSRKEKEMEIERQRWRKIDRKMESDFESCHRKLVHGFISAKTVFRIFSYPESPGRNDNMMKLASTRLVICHV